MTGDLYSLNIQHKMSLKIHLSMWISVFLVVLLQVKQGNASWFHKAPAQARKRPTKNCGPSAWSSWSECTPFCGINPQRTRTQTLKQGNECVSKKETQGCSSKGGCSDLCDAAKKKCNCYKGYTLAGDKTCNDINECGSNNGRGECSHKCENLPGSFLCKCDKGYVLKGRTQCSLLDCSTPKFSKCDHTQTTTKAEANLPLCKSILKSCKNGTTYNAQCTLSCPKNYKLALKKSTTKWTDYTEFDFNTASNKIICHNSEHDSAIWHTRLTDYHCRRGNDPPLTIKLKGDFIKEGLPPGSIVGRLSTTDAQKGQEMVYSVQNKLGKSLFRCNASVLETSKVFAWYPRGQNSYAVRIRAQDNGSPPMWREDVFNISVQNVNDPPRNIEISRNMVNENASIGTVVGELSAIDDDLGNQRTSNFSWKLLKDNSGNFNITGNKVVLRKTLNYDHIKLCYILVACDDEHGATTVKDIPIYVINSIDPPTIDLKGNSIAENSKLDAVITQITSKSESNENLYFMLSETYPNATLKFGLSPQTVCEHHENATKFKTTCYVNITVRGKLDYEKTREYTLQIFVRNGVSSNFVKWNIKVENVNEKPDELAINWMKEIPEDTKSGIDIGFLTVSDPDNRNVITQNHSCHVVNNAEQGQYFHVNNERNSLQVKKNMSLNYEKHQSYSVSIQCNDSGVPSLSIKRNFVINITDTDEPIQNITLSDNKVRENSKIGVEVGEFDAHDPDVYRPKTMKFSLVHNLPFALKGENNQMLVVNDSLNFENISDYLLTVRVTDSAGRALQTSFIINVIDVNEAPTDIKLNTSNMNENLSSGSFISNIKMIDEDDNTITTCSLLEDGGGRIALNETSLLAGEKNTDYEQLISPVINISLSCCDQMKKCVTKKFNISVQDVNEPPTDINIDKLQVKENEKDVTVGKITISDPDSNPDYYCSLSAANETSHLMILNSNKTLHLIKEFNFEEKQMVTFEIKCQERGSSSMYFTKQFDLKIADVNEAPIRGCEAPIYASNEQSTGTVISKLLAFDPDNEYNKDPCQPKQKLTYTQTGSEENSPFKIVGGYLVKTGPVEDKKYIFGVSVQDDGVTFLENFMRIYVSRKTTIFNCTIISSSLTGVQVTLSSNQIRQGSPNASTIGYLGTKPEQDNMKYEIIQDQCNNSPFAIERNKLMLMLSSYTGPITEDDYTAPQHAMVLVKASSDGSGLTNYTRFVIFINADVKTHKQICFSTNPVRRFDISTTKLGPVIIYNNTESSCPTENIPHPPPQYKCDVKLNMNSSSQVSTLVTNAFYVDNEMFLRVNKSINNEVSSLDLLVLDLFCWNSDRLFSFVKGSVEIPLDRETICVKDNQLRDDSLCNKSQLCPEDALCSKVVKAGQRCVANDDQLFVVMSPSNDAESFCKFESCLQKVLSDPENDCLLHYNDQRRKKRDTEKPLYLDNLNITYLSQHKKLLLRAAVWVVQDGGELILKKSLPDLQDSNDITFISTIEECDLLKNERIKCPVKDAGGKTNQSVSEPLKNHNIQVAIGVGVGIILIFVIILFLYCWRRRRQHNKQVKANVQIGEFTNMAFDDGELKELPPTPNDNVLNAKKKDKRKLKYDFKNPVYADPTEDEEKEICKEECPRTATYAQPEEIVEQAVNETKTKKAISNPFYEAADVIAIQKPQNDTGNYTCVYELNEKTSSASKEPEYETLPPIRDQKVSKKGWFRFSRNENRTKNSKQGSDNIDQQIQPSAVYATVNKGQQKANKQQPTSPAKEPHYEELPLPNEHQINQWKQQTDVKTTNDGNINEGLDIETPNEPHSKNGTYEDIPPLKEENKRKGIFQFSKAFKNNDGKNSKEESKSEPNSNCSNQDEMLNRRESMLNPRDKFKKDDPANKYPFYEELPPVRDPKRTESFFTTQQVKTKEEDRNSSSAYYHELEANTEGEMNTAEKQIVENIEDGPCYFILEKSDSTSNGNKQYQSLHRELGPPSPTYEAYRPPQKSGTESGSQENEVSSSVNRE